MNTGWRWSRPGAVVIAGLLSSGTHAFDLTVTVQGAATAMGSIRSAVYAGESGWLKEGGAAQSQSAPASPAGTIVVYRGLSAGTYSVSAFHDENDNQQLDTLLLGIPRERYGFSRDARALFGPPGFADAAIELRQDTAIVLKVR